MIKIVNWILTRRCNLNCHYCRITKDYNKSPYPNYYYYRENEMSTNFIIKGLEWFKSYNPFCFHIFYGGEPLLRKDLPEVINYCNKNNIFYTIISNNTDEIQDAVNILFSKVEYVSGFTISTDPISVSDKNSHRFYKSSQGLKNLMRYINRIKDPVAEIVVDNSNVDYMIPLVEHLTFKGISSDITFIDIIKSQFYDFSNISDPSLCVLKNDKLLKYFETIILDNLNVHMADTLLYKIFDILPSDLDCKIENNIHNLTIDADGSIRLCLRIRGIQTPSKKLFDYVNDSSLNKELVNNIRADKLKYCKKCNWTCPIMTMSTNNNKINHVEGRS